MFELSGKGFTSWAKGGKKHKYGAVKQSYNGQSYDSKFEAKVAEQLDWRLKAGEFEKWEGQRTIHLEVEGRKICGYRIDFVITHFDGHLEFLEAKGFPTEQWRLKHKLFEALHKTMFPGSEYTVIYNR